jgi:hypothetical protein
MFFTPNFNNLVKVYRTSTCKLQQKNYPQNEIHGTGYLDMPRRTIFLSFLGYDQTEDKPSPKQQTEQEGWYAI